MELLALVFSPHVPAALDDQLVAVEPYLDLLALQGIGPKKIAALYSELGVVDLDTLQTAAESGDIPSLKGFSKKTEAKIL